jgi:hypothetical protein
MFILSPRYLRSLQFEVKVKGVFFSFLDFRLVAEDLMGNFLPNLKVKFAVQVWNLKYHPLPVNANAHLIMLIIQENDENAVHTICSGEWNEERRRLHDTVKR